MYKVSWKRPTVYKQPFQNIEWEGGFKTKEEAQKFADCICAEYADCEPAQLQVFRSIKIEEFNSI